MALALLLLLLLLLLALSSTHKTSNWLTDRTI
jgi:hypothetical protein